jgi:hypothetical protein
VNGAILHGLDHRLGLVGEKAVKKATTTDKQYQKQGKPKRQLVHTSSQEKRYSPVYNKGKSVKKKRPLSRMARIV